jgi:hypothetical protein
MNWKRIFGGTLAALLFLFVVAMVGGYFYLHSRSFQEFAVREIVKQADLATGGKTQIGRLEIDCSMSHCEVPRARISLRCFMPMS